MTTVTRNGSGNAKCRILNQVRIKRKNKTVKKTYCEGTRSATGRAVRCNIALENGNFLLQCHECRKTRCSSCWGVQCRQQDIPESWSCTHCKDAIRDDWFDFKMKGEELVDMYEEDDLDDHEEKY